MVGVNALLDIPAQASLAAGQATAALLLELV